MNVAVNLFGLNPFITDAEANQLRATLAVEQELIASLDAEIASALAQLKRLKEQRKNAEQLFHSNSAPSEAEVAQISGFIQNKEADLERLQADIDTTQDTLRHLMSERDRVKNLEAEWHHSPDDADHFYDALEEDYQATLNRLDSEIQLNRASLSRLIASRDSTIQAIEQQRLILSPIRRIPLEVLSEIFLKCLPPDQFINPSPHSAPLLLSQICQSWRSLSFSMGRLWTSIRVELTKEGCSPHPLLVEAWLARSGHLPLVFQVVDRLTPEDIAEHRPVFTAAPMIARFIRHVHRWQAIDLDFTDWRVDTGLDSLSGASLPILESLGLSRDFWVKEDADSLRVLLSAPHLRELRWSVRHSHVDPMKTISLAQMTTIHIECFITLDDFRSILAQSSSLVSGHFSVLKESEGTETPSILLRKLYSLDLAIGGSIDSIFEGLTAPSLNRLRISKALIFTGIGAEQFWNAGQVSSFISRSGCVIDQLELMNTDIQPSEMVNLLQRVSSSLVHLTVSDDGSRFPINDDVLRALTCQSKNGDRNLCPNLEYIKLWGGVKSTDGLVADLIQSRWDLPHNCCACWKKLDMVLLMLRPTADHSQDLARLNKLNETRLGSITII